MLSSRIANNIVIMEFSIFYVQMCEREEFYVDTSEGQRFI